MEGNPGTALQLRKVDFLQRELVPLLSYHLLNGLCHNREHGYEIRLFHLVSFHRGWLYPQCKGTAQIINNDWRFSPDANMTGTDSAFMMTHSRRFSATRF